MADVVERLGEVGDDVRSLPPAVMTWWIRVKSGVCSRSSSAAWLVSSTASRADRPASGAAAAWALVPWNRNLAAIRAWLDSSPAAFWLEGCQCSTASQSSNRWARTMNALALPPSSAGQP